MLDLHWPDHGWPHSDMRHQDGIWTPFVGTELLTPLVGIMMGSKSDHEIMAGAAKGLDEEIGYEVTVRSTHREPEEVAHYARTAEERGLKVIIAGAGLAAALPGSVAAHTNLPVIGVPLTSRDLSAAGGLDSILAILQMPPGVPVAAVGLNNPKNAGVLASQILRLTS